LLHASAAGLLLWAQRAADVEQLQHGTQQQMRAVSRLTYEAEHGFVFIT